MNENDYTFQTITLDVPSYAVFTEDGKVFYDMQAMALLLTQDVASFIGTLEAEGALPEATEFVSGQITIIERIQQQADVLTTNYKMQQALAAVTSVEDMFTS